MVLCVRLLAIPLSLTISLASTLRASTVKALVTLFESRYRAAHSLQVTFLERYSENGHVERMEAGTAYFESRGKMRWEYNSPEENLFLVDGRTAWFYVPADRTVTQVPAKESGDWRTPFALLTGGVKVSHVCSRVEIAPTERAKSPENALLYCVVRGQPAGATQGTESRSSGAQPLDAVFFEITRDTGQLARVLVRQSGGIELEFQFANWKFNPPLPESLFHFAPPLGVAVVNGEVGAGSSVKE